MKNSKGVQHLMKNSKGVQHLIRKILLLTLRVYALHDIYRCFVRTSTLYLVSQVILRILSIDRSASGMFRQDINIILSIPSKTLDAQDINIILSIPSKTLDTQDINIILSIPSNTLDTQDINIILSILRSLLIHVFIRTK